MTKNCSNCGYQNIDEAKFCINCGTPLLDSQNNYNTQSDLEWFAEKLYTGEMILPTSDCPIILKKSERPIIVLQNVIFK